MKSNAACGDNGVVASADNTFACKPPPLLEGRISLSPSTPRCSLTRHESLTMDYLHCSVQPVRASRCRRAGGTILSPLCQAGCEQFRDTKLIVLIPQNVKMVLES